MSRRKKRGMQSSRRVDFATGNPEQNKLIERAEVCEMLYGTLLKHAPEDDEGIKTAYVSLDDDHYGATVAPNQGTMDLYGMKAVRIAELQNPWPLIPREAGPPAFNSAQQLHRSLLRQVLTKIVDEA